jgi:peptidoglycan biosynthesis protein MviN/MurJ (putative lipid II flippase)
MQTLDLILISFYRLTGYPLVDYFLGTFLLALLAVVAGEFTLSLVYRVNRKHMETLNSRVEKMKRLSSEALALGDQEGYKACNKEGNDAFGQLFFNKFGLSAASLWPIFFALAWMQDRFREIELPFIFSGWTVNYVFVFLACYILTRILFSKVKRHLPYFKGVHRMLASYKEDPSRP